MTFQSTPPARAATAASDHAHSRALHVSIHAARAGGDSPAACVHFVAGVFQSTPPARAATRRRNRDRSGEHVSIHAARAGGDKNPAIRMPTSQTFQSTPPARAATRLGPDCIDCSSVSIHAARAGGDASVSDASDMSVSFNPRRPRGRRRCASAVISTRRRCFNPRRPRGRRRRSGRYREWLRLFQSTPPARAATGTDGGGTPAILFQSTPPARAATATTRPHAREPECFNPRRPRGRRQGSLCSNPSISVVSIHAARAGGDCMSRAA